MTKQHRKTKRPSREAKGRNAKRSTDILSQRKAMQEMAVAAFGLLLLFGMPYVIHAIVAPLKGWC